MKEKAKKKKYLPKIALLAGLGFLFTLSSSNDVIKSVSADEAEYIVEVDYGDYNFVSYRKKKGEKIQLNANSTSSDGRPFFRWSASGGGGSFASENNPNTTYTVGINDASITANYYKYVVDPALIFNTPKEGNTPDISPEIDTLGASYGDVKYYRGENIDDSKLMSSSDTFIKGETYTVLIYVGAYSGYSYSGKGFYIWHPTKEKAAYFNGEKAIKTELFDGALIGFKKSYVATGLEVSITIETSEGIVRKSYANGDNFSLNSPQFNQEGKIFTYWSIKYGDVDIIDSRAIATNATVKTYDTYIVAVYLTLIDEFAFTLEEPQNGKKPMFVFNNLINNQYIYDFTHPLWHEVTFDSLNKKYNEVKRLVSDDTFTKDKLYKFSFYIEYGDEYQLNSNYKVLINGKDVSSTYVQDGRYMTFYAIFTASGVKHPLTIDEGKAYVDGSEVNLIEVGKEVTIKANEKDGYRFIEWVITLGDVKLVNTKSATTTFIMPDEALFIKATYKKLIDAVNLNVAFPVDGNKADFLNVGLNSEEFTFKKIAWYKGNGVFVSQAMNELDLFEKGKEYTVTVQLTAIDGYIFSYESKFKECFINNIKATTIVGDGTENVTFAATFTAIEKSEKVKISVINGTFFDGTSTNEFEVGSLVTVKANEIENKKFSHWLDQDKQIISSNNPYSFNAFKEITLTATYVDIVIKVKITLINGTFIDGSTIGEFPVDSLIRIKANIMEGKDFLYWKNQDDAIVSKDNDFYYKVDKETTLTAYYTDPIIPVPEPSVDDNSLHPGAIVAIVLGSVAVAEIGGFSLVYFAIKKKTWADFIALFKKK